jgi:hypothetical protein
MTFLAAEGQIVDMALLAGSATPSRCASRDQIAEGLLLGCTLGHHPSPETSLCIKEAKLGGLGLVCEV